MIKQILFITFLSLINTKRHDFNVVVRFTEDSKTGKYLLNDYKLDKEEDNDIRVDLHMVNPYLDFKQALVPGLFWFDYVRNFNVR